VSSNIVAVNVEDGVAVVTVDNVHRANADRYPPDPTYDWDASRN
jgi:hypothetical protein